MRSRQWPQLQERSNLALPGLVLEPAPRLGRCRALQNARQRCVAVGDGRAHGTRRAGRVQFQRLGKRRTDAALRAGLARPAAPTRKPNWRAPARRGRVSGLRELRNPASPSHTVVYWQRARLAQWQWPRRARQIRHLDDLECYLTPLQAGRAARLRLLLRQVAPLGRPPVRREALALQELPRGRPCATSSLRTRPRIVTPRT
jgi:hypothetical protein